MAYVALLSDTGSSGYSHPEDLRHAGRRIRPAARRVNRRINGDAASLPDA
ncbi:hypothetical protein C7S13_7774 [Burkholderia cepacia]|nr:hypothetical protein [Burkholderia cepacia]